MTRNARRIAKAAGKAVAKGAFKAGKQAAKDAGLGPLISAFNRAMALSRNRPKPQRKRKTQRVRQAVGNLLGDLSRPFDLFAEPVANNYQLVGPMVVPPTSTGLPSVVTYNSREYWGFPGSVSDTWNLAFSQEFDFNSIIAKMGVVASTYTEARLRRVVVVYKPTQGTSSNGQVMIACSPNPSDDPPGNEREFYNFPNTVFQRGIPGTWNIPLDGPFKGFDPGWKKISSFLDSSPGPSDLQSVFPGIFYVATQNCGVTPQVGSLYLDVEVELRGSTTVEGRTSSDFSWAWSRTLVGDPDEDADWIPLDIFASARKFPRGIRVAYLPGFTAKPAFQFLIPGRYIFTLFVHAPTDYPNLGDVKIFTQVGTIQSAAPTMQSPTTELLSFEHNTDTLENVLYQRYDVTIEQLMWVAIGDIDPSSTTAGTLEVQISWVKVK